MFRPIKGFIEFSGTLVFIWTIGVEVEVNGFSVCDRAKVCICVDRGLYCTSELE